MRAKRSLCLVLCMLCLFSCPAFAHSGRTDANGGHYNRSTGEYHYHHGYPAHQHYDIDGDGIVDCPYNFDDRTGASSGTSSGSDRFDTYVPSSTPRVFVPSEYYKEHPEEAPWSSKNSSVADDTKSGKNRTWETIKITFVVMFLTPLGWCTIGGVCVIAKWIWEHISQLKGRKQKRAEYFELYANKPISQIVDIPKGSKIASDGMPATSDVTKPWGLLYTFYISDTGSVYHRYRGCSGAYNTINAYSLRHSSKYRPCKRCAPSLPDTQWVDEYKRIEQIKKKYKIP